MFIITGTTDLFLSIIGCWVQKGEVTVMPSAEAKAHIWSVMKDWEGKQQKEKKIVNVFIFLA